MPKYFFDVFSSNKVVHDHRGDDLVDAGEARDVAKSLLTEIAEEEIGDADRYEVTIDTRNERGEPVYKGSLTFEGHRGTGR